MALLYGASIEVACAVLGEFAGVSRRFDLRGQRHDITFVDDYAHLPAEISAVLRASRAAGNSWGRIVAVFQPNRFHRMAAMSGEYCDAFVDADVVVIGDIYASGTAPIAGVTGQLVVDAIRKSHPEAEVYYVPGRADLAARVADQLRSGDLCISTGCGDIETLPSETMTEIDMRDIEVALTRAKIKWQRSMPMGERTTYKVGGAARLGVFIAANAQFEALAAILARYEVPVVVLGRGSNTLVADTGFAGVCVLLGEFANTVIVESRNGSQVDVVLGGATPLPVAARQLSALGVTGFEWAVGVPGTVGGAVKMNAGGHGSDMARNLVQAHVINLRTGRSVWMPVEDLGLRFRGSSLPDGCVVSAVQLRLAECVPGEGDAEIAEVVRWRRENQPGGQNAGSVFVNPDDGAQSAGAIIDALGLRGFRIGSAAVSEKHANFIQADPEGTSADVLRVMTEVHRRVQEATGIHLHSEVRLVGFDRHLSFLIDTSVL